MSQPKRRKSASDRKAQIVETAIRLSAEIGPDRVTTQHLANEIGVTQPAIFRHFATKSDIWSAVGERISRDFTQLYTQPDDLGQDDPHSKLHRLVSAHLAHISLNPAIPAILSSRELQAENATLRKTFAALLNARHESIAGLIRSAQKSGLHRAEMAAEDAAHLLTSAMHGLSMNWLLNNGAFDLAEEGGRMLGGLIDGFRA
ncbi:MAG TPA: TetR/AcrR family transcriptional regulator [Rhodobacterales bacterium]|nr:TetR/AcrR family transcriptional regulator [Rhodobacterales bacterium]